MILKHVPAVDALRTDMEEILARCEEIRLESVLLASPLRRLMRIALRSVAPLM